MSRRIRGGLSRLLSPRTSTLRFVASLSEEVRTALERARAARFSYAVRTVRAPDGRLVVILGEAHLKLEKASAIGKEAVRAFELRGVESFARKKVLGGRLLGVLIQGPRSLLCALSLGMIKGSTITDARMLSSGVTVELERADRMPFGLHVASLYLIVFHIVLLLGLATPYLLPTFVEAVFAVALLFQVHMIALIPAVALRRYSWCWLVHPLLGILTLRDALMVQGTIRMLEEHPHIREAVVVMGRAHVKGYERLLVEQHGFARISG